MRWRAWVVTLVFAVTACVGAADEPGDRAAVETSAPATTSMSVGPLGTTTSADAGAALPVEVSGDGERAAPSSSVAPTSAPKGGGGFEPPEPGEYTYHVVGTRGGRTVDRADVTTVERVDVDTTRIVEARLTTVLRFEDAQVSLLSLDATAPAFQRHFNAAPPVVDLTLPPAGSWSWELVSSNGQTHLAQESTVRAEREQLSIMGSRVDAVVVDTVLTISGDVHGTICFTNWLDPARSIAVRTHSVTDFGQLFSGDTTAEVVAVA